jgi:hypothetical protein
MKPYSFTPKADVGCCPGHDWPVCYRWAGKYSSHASKKSASKCNKMAKRSRRRADKRNLGE